MGPGNDPPLMETMWVNHYCLKSLEDWNAKRNRFKGWKRQKDAFANRDRLGRHDERRLWLSSDARDHHGSPGMVRISLRDWQSA